MVRVGFLEEVTHEMKSDCSTVGWGGKEAKSIPGRWNSMHKDPEVGRSVVHSRTEAT